VNTPAGDAAAPTPRPVNAGETICPADAVAEGDSGVRFAVQSAGGVLPAFVIRYQGEFYAYVNRCAHQAVPLDWNEGGFFSSDGHFLMCATHGARYHPATGACAGGRCNGRGLTPLKVRRSGQDIVLL